MMNFPKEPKKQFKKETLQKHNIKCSEEGQNGRIKIAKKSLWDKVWKYPNPMRPAKRA